MLDENFCNELMLFIESGAILKPSELSVDLSNIVFIDDFEIADELVTEQECDHCELSWIELRAEKIMDVLNDARNESHELYSFVKKDLESYRAKFSRAFYKRKLKVGLSAHAVEALTDITSDLFDIMVDHTVYGKNSNFYKIMFQLYKDGFWPCGWKGDLPNDDCSNGTWLVFRSSLQSNCPN